MTTVTLSATARPGFGALLSALRRFFAGVRDGREIWHRYETLSRLSDTELAWLGLTRDQVPQAAVKGL
jgi:uncharacterized protein YjiS (DUF1127 family)